MSSFNEKWEKNNHDKANNKVYIEISANTNTNTLKSEVIMKITVWLISHNINPLIVS